MNHILSGDIGGTQTRLRLSAINHGEPVLQKYFPSNQYSGLVEIIAEFLRQANTTAITSACFALAGPVLGRRAQLTNLPWSVDADQIAQRFNIPRVSLINDFEAVGRAIEALQSQDLLTLQPGQAQQNGVRLAVGAGTGLGVVLLTWQQGNYSVHPSEGGHMDFAPSDGTQYELLHYLQQRHGHVSYERIVSGPGLVAIFEFLRDSGRALPSEKLLQAMASTDAAAVITQFAQRDQDPTAVMALNLFVSIYGAFVGNLALVSLPRGGIYVAGGIAAKIAPFLQHGEFMRAFRDKGRFAGLLETLPLHIVIYPDAGLLGAQHVAQRTDGNITQGLHL